MGNRVIFKIKTGYYLELLTPETLKLLASIKNKITDDKNSEYFSLFISHFLSPKNCTFLKTVNSEFSYIEVWLTHQNSKLMVVEDKAKINLAIT